VAKRVYTKADRVAALAALAANAGNLARTARQLGIPRNTLQDWAKGAAMAPVSAEVPDRSASAFFGAGRMPNESRSVAREAAAEAPAACASLATKLEAIAHRIADVIPGKIESASLQQLSVSLGIAIEKMRLLRGQATEIRCDELTDEQLDQRIRDTEARLAVLATGQPAERVSA
jgi:transposase-like protein